MIANLFPSLGDRRVRIGLIVVFLAALIVCFPMRIGFALMGLDKAGLSARDVRGSLWAGRLLDTRIADVEIGSVRAGLSPIQIFVGRARLDMARQLGRPDDIKGAIGVTASSFGIDDVTAGIPIGGLLAPMPVSAIDMSDVSVRFDHGVCARAEGRVRATIAGYVPGLSLAQGLSGEASCAGAELLLPLASQSGMETLNLRITADGRYTARFLIRTPDPALGKALGSGGFSVTADGYSLRLRGTL